MIRQRTTRLSIITVLVFSFYWYTPQSLGEQRNNQAAAASQQGADNAAAQSKMYQQAAGSTDDPVLKGMLMMMAMQQQMQQTQSELAAHRNQRKQDEKEEREKAPKIPTPTPLPKSELKPTQVDEKNLIDLSSSKRIGAGSGSSSSKTDSSSGTSSSSVESTGSGSQALSSPTEIAKNFAPNSKNQAETGSRQGSAGPSALQADGVSVPGSIPDRRDRSAEQGASQLPSTNVAPVLRGQGVASTTSSNLSEATAASNSSDGESSVPSRRPSSVPAEAEGGGGSGGEAVAANSGGQSGENFFDMLMKGKQEDPSSVLPQDAYGDGASTWQASPEPVFNIFQVAQLRYQYAAYKEKRLRTKP